MDKIKRSKRAGDGPAWSRAQLQVHSKTVLYELQMLVAVASRYRTIDESDTVLSNMHLESYAIHCRAMVVFIHHGNEKDDTLWDNDIVAKDFCADWPNTCPPQSAALQAAKFRADKHVMHILNERANLNQPGSELESRWDMVTPTTEICKTMSNFFAKADPANFDAEAHAGMQAVVGQWLSRQLIPLEKLSGTNVFKSTIGGPHTTDPRTLRPGSSSWPSAKTEPPR